MISSCKHLLDKLLERDKPNWSISTSKEIIHSKVFEKITDINFKQEEYSSAVFKKLWTKDLDIKEDKVTDTITGYDFSSTQYNDELDPTHLIFNNGKISSNFGCYQAGIHVWHDAEDKLGNVYNYYKRIISLLDSSTIPGLLASSLTNSANVVCLSTDATDVELISNKENNKNGLNTGIYIMHVRNGAEVNVTETITNTSDMNLNKWIWIVGYNAKLNLTRKAGNTNGVIDDVCILQYPDSEVTINTYDKEDQYRHLDITAYQDTKTTVNGSVLCKNSSSVHNVIVNHKGDNSTSRIKYHSAIYDSNVTDFIGSINVEKCAVGTDSSMINKNLLMDETSKAKSIPKLNINTKEIECTHGCTISNIDEDELYYLETLGVSKNKARRLIADGHIQI